MLRQLYFLVLAVGICIKGAAGGLFWSDETLSPNILCPEAAEECDYSLDNQMIADPYDSSTGLNGGANSGYIGNQYSPGNSEYGGNPSYAGSSGYLSGQGFVGSSSFITPQSQQNQNPPLLYFNENLLVGLHPTLPIGSYVRVLHPEEDASVDVQIIGRPVNLSFGRCMTLSKAAFAQIANLGDGTVHCFVTYT